MVFEAICESSKVKIGKSNYYKESLLYLTTCLNGISILVFVMAIFWIRLKQNEDHALKTYETINASDYTVSLYTLPAFAAGATLESIKHQIKTFFQQALYDPLDAERIEIADINLSTASTSYLDATVARGIAAVEVDRVVARLRARIELQIFDRNKLPTMVHIMSLKRSLLEFELCNDRCQKLSNDATERMYSAFVTFETESSLLKCLKKFPNFGLFSR